MRYGVILKLESKYSLNGRGGLININDSITGWHHHIDGDAGILTIF